MVSRIADRLLDKDLLLYVTPSENLCSFHVEECENVMIKEIIDSLLQALLHERNVAQANFWKTSEERSYGAYFRHSFHLPAAHLERA